MQSLRKYRVQHDETSCGPIAVYNFFVWAGMSPNRLDLNIIKKILNANNQPTDFDIMLTFMNVFAYAYRMSYMATRSIKDPIKVLQAGGSFMMVFDSGHDDMAHICFCRGIKKGKLSFINMVAGKKELLVTKHQFKNLLINNKLEPIFILIEK